MTETMKNTILTLRAQGEGYGAIGKRFGLSRSTVQSICRRADPGTPAPAPDKTCGWCKCCGQAFERKAHGRPASFCSDTCQQTWWMKHRKLTTPDNPRVKNCLHCGAAFSAYANPEQVYCSRRCYFAARYGKESAT